jgi:hypothetical protein
MVLFAEPAGGNFPVLDWEVVCGCPLLVVAMTTAVIITMLRALRAADRREIEAAKEIIRRRNAGDQQEPHENLPASQ